ncbi:MAG TPA: MarR family winged helix-turn-helix transcriptional regulator [Polyangiaceae bacterium]|nr:MarR family winged helix-turn-helix transcriptional regulator [Polyangiaceae bacterium]
MAENEQTFRANLETEKRASVAQLLFKCARLVNERALARVRERRGVEIRPAHTALFPHIDVTRGSRLTDLAQALGVSKQAVGQLVDELSDMGMLERRSDPDDGRAKRVCYTSVGRQGLFDGLAILREEEQAMERAIGTERFQQLHTALLALEAVLEPEASGAAS